MSRAEPFGQWLKQRRKLLNLTQQHLAQEVGCSVVSIRKYESGERRPSRQIAEQLALKLQIPHAQRNQFVAFARSPCEEPHIQLDLESTPHEHRPLSTLPSQSTPFIGREEELTSLKTLLGDPACRLLTLVGPGGIGKTRIALEVAERQPGNFQDGVYFVPLVSLRSPASIPLAIAEAIPFAFFSKQSPQQQLLSYLRAKEMLLILDSFEHLLAGTNLLIELLDTAPNVKILVTSRERLQLRAETVFHIGGMIVPDHDQATDVADYDAVQLLLDCVRRLEPDALFSPEALTYAARICRQTQGMPLAIVLAGTWSSTLSLSEIFHEIGRSIDFLEAVIRDAPERHHSIRAVFDSSWKMLAEPERNAFKQLSVFSGSFSREAAQAIADASLPVLAMLVNRSFLRHDFSGRYETHQLLQRYAAEQLAETPARETEIYQKHCQYYAQFIHSRQVGLRDPDSASTKREIEMEIENIRAGWNWAIEQCELDAIEQYTQGLWHYYDALGWYLAGPGDIPSYHRAIQYVSDMQHESTTESRLLSQLHESLGAMLFITGQRDEALDHFHQALACIPQNQVIRQARLHREIGGIQRLNHQHDATWEMYDKAKFILGDHPSEDSEKWWHEYIQIQLECIWLGYWQGHWHMLDALDEDFRALIETYGTPAQQVNFFIALSSMIMRHNRHIILEKVLTYLGIALDKSLESGNSGDIAWSHFVSGFAYLWHGDLDEAEEHIQRSLTVARQNGDIVHEARCLTYLTLVYRKRKDIVAVRDMAAQGLAVAKLAELPEYVGMAKANQAWVAWGEKDWLAAETDALIALETWTPLALHHASLVFKWTALWPLIGIKLRSQQIKAAINYAREVLDPSQQRLPDTITNSLETAIQAWEQGQRAAAYQHLIRALYQSDLLLAANNFPIVVVGTDTNTLVIESLTSRELEVLELIAAGCSNQDIAGQLNVEVSTVKKHINHLYAKLDVDSRTRAIIRAQELHLI